MRFGDIKVVNYVSKVIVVVEDSGIRVRRQPKGNASLFAMRQRLHSKFHDALAYSGAIEEACDMADGVVHRLSASAVSLTPHFSEMFGSSQRTNRFNGFQLADLSLVPSISYEMKL